jgi:sec-independent protein translocase protein TatB
VFDIGFPELMLVSIVALLVIGPERLPETIRSIMLWIGRIRRTFTNIKTELEQELGADEIRRQLHNETILKEINESKNQIQGALKEADQSIEEMKSSINDSVEGAKAAAKQDSDSESDIVSDTSNPLTSDK